MPEFVEPLVADVVLAWSALSDEGRADVASAIPPHVDGVLRPSRIRRRACLGRAPGAPARRFGQTRELGSGSVNRSAAAMRGRKAWKTDVPGRGRDDSAGQT